MEPIQLTTPDGVTLEGTHWPCTGAKALVLIVHGLGEHHKRYQHLIPYFHKNGFAVLGYDQRGHGLSTGARGHIPKAESFLDDLGLMLDYAGNLTDKPVILFGHSMGGCIVAAYMLKRNPENIREVWLSAPYFQLAFDPPAWKRFLGEFMAGIMPSFAQSSGLDVSALAMNPTVVRLYKSDPLVHDQISAGLFKHITALGRYVLDHATNWPEIPVRLIHGEADRITRFEASKAFAETNPNALFLPIPGGYHEWHQDDDWDKWFDKWLEMPYSQIKSQQE